MVIEQTVTEALADANRALATERTRTRFWRKTAGAGWLTAALASGTAYLLFTVARN